MFEGPWVKAEDLLAQKDQNVFTFDFDNDEIYIKYVSPSKENPDSKKVGQHAGKRICRINSEFIQQEPKNRKAAKSNSLSVSTVKKSTVPNQFGTYKTITETIEIFTVTATSPPEESTLDLFSKKKSKRNLLYHCKDPQVTYWRFLETAIQVNS